MCTSGASRILRHTEVRNIIVKACKDIGYEIGMNMEVDFRTGGNREI